MNQEIAKLLRDSAVAQRIKSLSSVAEAAAVLAEAAAQRGVTLGADAIAAMLASEPGRPRELADDELLAVGGGMRPLTRRSECDLYEYCGP